MSEIKQFKQNLKRIGEIDGLSTHKEVYDKTIELLVYLFESDQASIILYKRLGPAKIFSNKEVTSETEAFFANHFIWRKEEDVYPTTIIPDLHKTPFINEEITEYLFQLEIESLMTIPLITGGEVIGALTSTYCSPRTFKEDDGFFIERLAQKFVYKIEQLNLYDKTSRQTNFYEAIFDHSFDSVVAFDEKGLVLDKNHNFRKLFGLSDAENHNLKLPDLLSDGGEWEELIPILESGVEIKEQPFLLVTKDNKSRSIVRNIKKIGYNTYLALIKDRTKELKNLFELKLMSTAISQAPFSIFITDNDGVIIYTNEQFCETTGYTQPEIIGQTPRILRSGTVSETTYKELWETISSGKEWRNTIQNKRKDGSLYWSSIIITGIKNKQNKITHYITFQADVTKIKKIQDDSAARLEELKSFYNVTIDREGRMAELKERIATLEKEVSDQHIEKQKLKKRLRLYEN